MKSLRDIIDAGGSREITERTGDEGWDIPDMSGCGCFCLQLSGWVLETVTAAVRQKRFVNRGLVNGPLCVIYGITGSALMLVCRDLRGSGCFLEV